MRLAHGTSIKSAYTEDDRDVRMGAGLRGLHHAKSILLEAPSGPELVAGSLNFTTSSKANSELGVRFSLPRRLGSQPLRLCGLRAPQLRTPPSVLRAGNARSPRLLPIRSRILLLAAEAGLLVAQRPPSAHMGDEDVHVGHSTGSRARIHACWSCKTLNCMLRKFVVRQDLKLLVCPSGSAPRAFLQPGWLSDCLFLG